MPDRIHVTISSEISLSDRGSLCSATENAIAHHVQARMELIREIALYLTITECAAANGVARFAVTADGSVNGINIHKELRTTRSPGKLRNAGAGAGFGLGLVVNRVVVGLATNSFGVGEEAQSLDQCFQETIADLLLHIDQVIEHRESRASNAWRRLSVCRWIGVAIILMILGIVGVVKNGSKGLFFIFMPGMLAGPAVFWLIHLIGLALMPARFFHDDPRGRKAMARSGVTSVLALRFVCVALIVIFIIVLTCGAGILTELLTRKPRVH